MTKAKRATITPENEVQIRKYARKLYPTMERGPLAEKMQKELKWKRLPPEVEVLERKISGYRNEKTTDPLDQRWSLGALVEHPEISPEGLKAIWDVMVYIRIHNRRRPKSDPLPPLDIRNALWAARLNPFMPSIAIPAGEEVEPRAWSRAWVARTDFLWTRASLYADMEATFELTRQKEDELFDTSEWDEQMFDELFDERTLRTMAAFHPKWKRRRNHERFNQAAKQRDVGNNR